MIKKYFASYNILGSSYPFAVHTIMPPLKINVANGKTISKEVVRKGIAARTGIPEGNVQVLCYTELE